jgi:hypothetical protein
MLAMSICVCRPEANGTLPLNGRRLNIICISNHGDCIHISIIILTNDLLLKQDLNTKDLETNVIVLVRGGRFGAWCWYKTMSLLEDSGFKVNAIDLTGSGIHCSDTNKIEYAELKFSCCRRHILILNHRISKKD